MLVIFVLGYTAIALEHNIRIDKAASALVTGVLCWTVYVLGAMMPFMAVDWALAGGLRGAGDTRFPLIATIVGLIIVRLGLAAIATALGLSVVWVYAALMGDYITKAAMLGWRFYRGRWKKAIPA